MKTVFMGTPGFSLPALEALAELGLRIVAVYTKPDRPKGRGLRMEMPPVKQWAEARGLPVLQPSSLRKREAQEEFAGLRPDVVVVAAYGHILPKEVLEVPAKGFVNIHPSMLPLYRGTSPVVTALLDGAEATGVSLMLLDEGMDTGPLLACREDPILAEDTAESLTGRLFQKGADLLREALPRWLDGEIAPVPQDDRQATVTRMIRREDGEADWSLPAEVLERRVRAYTPWPGLYTYWGGKQIKILSATVVTCEGEPGLVLPLGQENTPIGIGTGRHVLGLRRVLLEGKRAVSATEFAQGYRDFVGSRLPG
jgi:methionyl-tRNA formyltransferase